MARTPKPKDERGPHTRLHHDIQDSHAWQALSFTERALYVALRRQLKSFNNGDISATVGTLAPHGFKSTSTIFKSLRALQTLGLIDKTRQGRIAFGGKTCSLYRFTDEPCLDIPKHGIKAMKTTNEWKAWKTRADASSAVLMAHESARNPNHKNSKKLKAKPSAENTSKVRISNRIDSPNEADARFSDSTPEQCEDSPIRLANNESHYVIGRKPASLLAQALSLGAAHRV